MTTPGLGEIIVYSKMGANPRAISRSTHRIECSRPEYRRSLLRASVLFALLLAGEVVLVTQLVSRDLSRQHIITALRSYRDDLQQIQRRVDEITEEGKFDLFQVKEKLVVITRAVNDQFAKRVAVEHIALYDVQGRQVMAVGRMRRDILHRRKPEEPQFPRKGEIPDGAGEKAPKERSNPDAFVPGNPFAAEEESRSPAPAADGNAATSATAADSDASGAEEPRLVDAPRTATSAEVGQVGPPAPPGRIQVGGRKYETLIIVPVGTGSGSGDPKGVIELGVNQELLESEAKDLQRDLMKKLAAGAFLSLVLLVVAFLYVLKLFQKTRRLEAEAQMADRLAYIGTLASGLAHEIRNPLNAMNMNLQMIEEEMTMAGGRPSLPNPGPVVESDDTRGLLESTRGEIKRLERLVSNFLAYARPSTPHVEERDLNEAIEDLVRFLKVDLSSAGIEVVTHLDPDLPPVAIDEAQFKQAILNILVNARQVLEPGGRIELVTGRTMQGEIFVRIADNGPGIPADQIDKVFEVFYSNRRGGTGLGLPIAQRILENHGGWIEVESEAGRGCAFTIVLPAEPRTVPAPSAAPESARTA